jgi:hypothetical protein
MSINHYKRKNCEYTDTSVTRLACFQVFKFELGLSFILMLLVVISIFYFQVVRSWVARQFYHFNSNYKLLGLLRKLWGII